MSGNYVPALSSAGSPDPDALRRVLDEVPSMFMKPPSDFYVEDTGVIDAAFSDEGAALFEQLEAQEQLVEGQLLAQIGSKFNSFFTLLNDFEGLQGEVEQACNCLAVIRGSMKTVGEPVTKGLRVSELMAQRRNLQTLYDKLDLVDHMRVIQVIVRSSRSPN